MAFIYANENFPRAVVLELRVLGHDVLTVQEAGQGEQAIEDPEVLRFATELERAVLTLNRKHFIRLHRVVLQHAGIIVCTYDPNFKEQAQPIHEVIKEFESLNNQLLRVNRPQQTESATS